MGQSDQKNCEAIFFTVGGIHNGKNPRAVQVARFLQNRTQRIEEKNQYFSFVFVSGSFALQLGKSSAVIVEMVDGDIGSRHWRPHPYNDPRSPVNTSAADYVVEIGRKAVETPANLKRCAEQIRNIVGRGKLVSSNGHYPWGPRKKKRSVLLTVPKRWCSAPATMGK